MSTKNVKVTNAETKETIIESLKSIAKKMASSNPEIALEINKAVAKKTTKVAVLKDLLARAIELGNKPVAPVENQVKPAPKKKAIKKSAKKSEETAPVAEKKPVEKAEPEIETVPQTGKNLPIIRYFPEELTLDKPDGAIKLKRRSDITSLEQLVELFQKGTDFYLATYWTPAHIKKYTYDASAMLPLTAKTKSFPHNLDILNLVYACANFPRVWAASTYTDAMFMFEGEDFEYFEEVNPFKEDDKFMTRASRGMEFEIYELVTD